MRDAAHRAEHLIDHGILNHDMISSDNIVLFSILLIMLSPLSSAILIEALLCTINGVFLYVWVRGKCRFSTRNASQELRRLFYDFKIIVEEANLIKESSGISAHEALVSLRRILGSVILDDSGYLKSLQEKVTFLLENNAAAASCTQNLDAKIRVAVHKAKSALIEFQLPGKSDLIYDWRRFCTLFDVLLLIIPTWLFMFLRIAYYMGAVPYYERISAPDMMPTQLEILGQMCVPFASYVCGAVILLAVLPVRYDYEALENQELPHVVDDFDIIVREVIKINVGCGEEGADLSTAAAASSRQDLGGNGRDVVVGLESDVEEMKARLVQDSSKLELISIVGMGGIGKTTLAKRVYHDPDIVCRFDVRAWTMISQGNTLRHVLLSLLDSAHMLTQEEKRQDSDDKLGVHLHKYLTSRRYLIVVDDVWDAEIWDFLSRHFPENYNDSRVLLTSRLPNVVSRLNSNSCLHHMQCLNENHSWDLLCREVFGAVEGCPLGLESMGKKIAKRCGGLPLAIVVIGGLLSQKIEIQMWTDIAENLEKSKVQDIKEQCLDILGLSYNNLPPHLKPCFLYTGLLLAHSEIPISKLIHLWIAEGFLRPRGSKDKTSEEEAEGYIKDLIERNLISVNKRSCDGKIKTCSMHDLLRDVCVKNAGKEKFRHIVESGGYVITQEGPDDSLRSLSIDPNAARVDDIHDYLDSMHLRVLNVLEMKFDVFPRRITQLFSLRYLAFHYDGSLPLPPCIYKLQYLETLVLHHTSFGKNSFLPSSIWRMPNLRHIHVKPGCYMFKLLGHHLVSNYSLLINLQTLVGIRNFKWTKSIMEKIPNLKKLGISYDFVSYADWSRYQLENLVYLEKLETLKIMIKYDDMGSAMPHDPQKLQFPRKLKKMSLSGCRIPWESMATIGELPNLEALKLRREAFCGPTWKTVEGEFPRLVFLLLEEMSFTTWESEESHFPRLQHLVLRSCVMLEEIPFSFGEVSSLELIQLVDCNPSAVASAKEIQEEQESRGNEGLKFHIEQWRREVNYGNVEGRVVMGPGVFEVLNDGTNSTQLEMMLSLLSIACFLVIVLAIVLVSLLKIFSFWSWVWGFQFVPSIS